MNDIEILREAARQMRDWGQMLVPLVDDLTDAGNAPEVEMQLRRDRDALPAIADWLDAAAQREEEHRQRSAHHAYADPTEGDEVYGALIVARAYLGEVAS